MTKVEEYIKKYTRHCSNELVSVETIDGKEVRSYHEWLTPENALSAAMIAREETIEKACRILEENLLPTKNRKTFVERIRKAMTEVSRNEAPL